MAYQLVAEVLDHAPPMSSTERLVLVSLAELAREKTRACGCPNDVLVRRACVDASNVRAALRRLAERKIEVRIPLGEDAKGRPVYAYRGRIPEYWIPHFLPAPEDCPCDGCKPEGERQHPPSWPPKAGAGAPKAGAGAPKAGAGAPNPSSGTRPSVRETPTGSLPDAVPARASAAPDGALAPQEDQPPSDEVLTVEQAKAQIAQLLNGRRRAKTSHWTEGTAPVGEPNPHYDHDVAGQLLVEAYDAADQAAPA